MSDELKPCPFCGCEGELSKGNIYGDITFYVKCKKCASRSHVFLVNHPCMRADSSFLLDENTRYTEEQAQQKAIESWNRRVDEPVRHGYWIPSPDGINPIRCSECNMPAPFAAVENEFGDFEICRYPSSYCHECGAKMDGVGKNEQ